jgi:hypothetical protein
MSQYSAAGVPLSPSTGWTNGGLNHPQGLVNTRAAVLIGKFGGNITVIGSDFKPVAFSPIQSSSFKWPLGLAIDSKNNAWVTNYFGSTVTQIRPSGAVAGVYHLTKTVLPWSEAIDGSDRVWVAGFATPHVWLLCGANTAACPPGSSTGTILSPKLGFQSAAFQHFTSIQIDQSGNIWLSNNWSELNPPTGGVGIVEIVGAATPVCTPLTPVPVRPSTATATTCPRQTATPLAAGTPASSAPPTAAVASAGPPGGTPTWGLAAIAAAVAVLAAGAVLFFRRRHARSLAARHG